MLGYSALIVVKCESNDLEFFKLWHGNFYFKISIIVVLVYGRLRSKITTVVRLRNFYPWHRLNFAYGRFKTQVHTVGTRSKFSLIKIHIYRGDINRGQTMDRSQLWYWFWTAVYREHNRFSVNKTFGKFSTQKHKILILWIPSATL